MYCLCGMSFNHSPSAITRACLVWTSWFEILNVMDILLFLGTEGELFGQVKNFDQVLKLEGMLKINLCSLTHYLIYWTCKVPFAIRSQTSTPKHIKRNSIRCSSNNSKKLHQSYSTDKTSVTSPWWNFSRNLWCYFLLDDHQLFLLTF